MNKTRYNGITTITVEGPDYKLILKFIQNLKMLNLSKILNIISIWTSPKNTRRISQEEEIARKKKLGDGAGERKRND